ncbi:MAG: DNA cytosine methyltransferase [Clostridia bacterium]|nr:DNA cytosine methyltransferase [Clostridia bacterium]MDY5555600.1 DNA cytosine methyltransferase [Blautia sp.]
MLPEIIDLFSGCGGLALGFDKAGYDIAGGIELVPAAWDTITSNLCWRYGKEQETHICGDIKEISGDIFKDRIGPEGSIIIGGPPCQAYSLAGRAKLQSLGEDRKNTNDSRGYLYKEFLRFIFAMKPKAVVMENVPEAANYGGKNIPQIVCESLEKNGYKAKWTILNSADYGVPQIRRRVFVIGLLKELSADIAFPEPTNRSQGNESDEIRKQCERFTECRNFIMPPTAETDKPWVTVGDALSDLPVLFPSADTKYHLKPINAGMKYRCAPENDYQKLMRSWFGRETSFVTANSFRKTVRDFPIFDKMKQGDNYLDASKIADDILAEEAKVYGYVPGTEGYEKLKKKIVPPYDREKFPDKWRRLDENKPSHTLVAHLSVDTYSHINPWEPRGISVREAARIQSFPDDFYFNCSMGDAYKQIGNAVPPLLSYNIAMALYKIFN